MPDDNIVVFGSEFSSEGVNKGVEEVVANLEKAKEAEKALKEEIENLNEELAVNEEEIKKVNEAMGLMGKVAGKNQEGIKKLNEQLAELNKTNEALKGKIGSSSKELDANAKSITKFSASQDKAKKSTNEIDKAVGKWTDSTKLAGKLVDDYGKKLFSLGKAAIEGFAIGFAAQALPALLDFIAGLEGGADSVQEYVKQAKIMGEINQKAAEIFAGDFAKVELFRAKLNDTNITQADRIKLAKEYNRTAEKGNEIDITQIDNLKLVNEQMNKQIALLRERALARAAENVIAEKAEDLFKKQADFEGRFANFTDKQLEKNKRNAQDRANALAKTKGLGKIDVNELFAFADLPEAQLQKIAQKTKVAELLLDEAFRVQVVAAKRRNELIETARKGERVSEAGLAPTFKALQEAQADFERALKVGAGLATVEGLLDPRKIENVFIQKLTELRQRLAQASATVFQSGDLIKKDFALRLKKDVNDIVNLVKAGSLTDRQGDILKGILKQINDVELGKALDDFQKKQEDAIIKINDSITNLQIEAATKRIANLHAEFEKERQTIDEDSAKTISVLAIQQRDLFRNIDEQVKQGLDKGFAARKKGILAAIFSDLIDQTEQERLRRQAALGFKQFQKFIADLQLSASQQELGISERATVEINSLATLFLQGRITYERYQRDLTKILQGETRERAQIELKAARDSLILIQIRIAQEKLKAQLSEADLKTLDDQEKALREKIIQLQRQVDTGGADEAETGRKRRLDNLVKYVEAIGALAQAVGSFWQQVNRAEAAALDRSIALQNKRVEFAQQIADKGNTEFLELEQKRLDELERKREANANRQLAIDNALALSQATVAAVTAIAQAVSTGSPFAALAAVAAVIGAIAAAYQFVNSLQPPVAQFAEGTESVLGPGGRDKIPAMLTKGERVTRARENKDYWDTLHAIHNRQIPPEVLNSFVNGYPATTVPLTDFDRLYAATNMSMGADSEEVLHKLSDLDSTMHEVVQAVGALGININMDADGFAASLSTYQRKKKRQKKA